MTLAEEFETAAEDLRAYSPAILDSSETAKLADLLDRAAELAREPETVKNPSSTDRLMKGT